MDVEHFRQFCLSLPGSSEGFPYGGDTLVFKVGNKMFTACDIDGFESFNLKALPETVIELQERYNCIHPGYHMNKKHWVTVESSNREISDKFREELILASHRLVYQSLTKAEKEKIKID